LAYTAGKEKISGKDPYSERVGRSRVVQNVHFIAKYDSCIKASLLMDSSPFAASEKKHQDAFFVSNMNVLVSVS